MEIIEVLEYSRFFEGEPPIDITETLKMFNRASLVRMATLLSLHYGNLCTTNPKKTFFSIYSQKHRKYLNQKFSDYSRNSFNFSQKYAITTYRTSIELWRNIFAINPTDFTNTIKKEDGELLLFKVVLSLNEKLVKFTEKGAFDADEIMFLSLYLTNDTNNYSFKKILRSQLYYFICFVQAIKNNDILSNATEILFKRWGIRSWQQYLASLMYIAEKTEKYIVQESTGIPHIDINRIHEQDKIGLFSASLIENFCIEENAYLPQLYSADGNIDYRLFRSKPFVKLSNDEGIVVINNQLLCERIFNSLYFDFSPLIKGSNNGIGFYNFNDTFVEKTLFRNTIFNCFDQSYHTYPERNTMECSEESHAPDFYCRKNEKIIIAECKAIKMNGEIKDDGDYVRLLDELHQKLVVKTKNLETKERIKTPKPVGIGQILYSINKIREKDFTWDKNIPNNPVIYPMLVFEDIRLLVPGLLSILNRWFQEELSKRKNLSDVIYKPLVAVSISTLFLHNELIRTRGLTNIIDDFLFQYSQKSNGKYILYHLADFEWFLNQNDCHKKDVLTSFFKEDL